MAEFYPSEFRLREPSFLHKPVFIEFRNCLILENTHVLSDVLSEALGQLIGDNAVVPDGWVVALFRNRSVSR
jgi:hypothetical protein